MCYISIVETQQRALLNRRCFSRTLGLARFLLPLSSQVGLCKGALNKSLSCDVLRARGLCKRYGHKWENTRRLKCSGWELGAKIVRGERLDYDSLKQEIFRLYFDVGLNQVKVTEQVEHLMEGGSLVQKYERVRKFIQKERKRRGSKPSEAVKQEKVEKPKKCVVVENREPVVIPSAWQNERTIRFGLTGDTHFNSKWVQITHLHDLYNKFRKAGIKNVYHAGDIDEGEQMRQGHPFECYRQGSDEHVAEIVKNYPKVSGINTHFILGNHDASFIKLSGQDIGKAIAKDRDDMIYLGRDIADIKLTPNCTLQLVHPWGGGAYALSYKPQKMLDAMSGGEKPNILAIGHFHKAMYFFYRNVHTFQVGTLQAQTSFMRGNSLAAMMGGWIVELDVAADGTINRIYQEWAPYYYAIKDDWQNWK